MVGVLIILFYIIVMITALPKYDEAHKGLFQIAPYTKKNLAKLKQKHQQPKL